MKFKRDRETNNRLNNRLFSRKSSDLKVKGWRSN